MASMDENIKWEIHMNKLKKLFKAGILSHKIISYETDSSLLHRLRTIYFENIPASIWLLCSQKCDYCCYDRAALITLGFGDDDFLLVDADVDSIALNPDIIDELRKNYNGKSKPHYSNHRFAIRKLKDGTIWVYDTSRGLIFDQKLYFEIENPKVTQVISKEQALEAPSYRKLRDDSLNIEEALCKLEEFESISQNEKMYKTLLEREIELFKLHLDYLSANSPLKKL